MGHREMETFRHCNSPLSVLLPNTFCPIVLPNLIFWHKSAARLNYYGEHLLDCVKGNSSIGRS